MNDPPASSREPRDDEDEAQDESRLDELVGEYIDRLNAGEMLDRDDILREHPDLGPAAVERMEMLFKLASRRDAETTLATIGDYTIRCQLGRGGMGVVYDAWQRSMDRRVALKVLPAGVEVDGVARDRLLREAQAAGQLSHPNIVQVYGLGVEGRTPYYAMEYVAGQTLAEVIETLRTAGDSTGERETAVQRLSRRLGERAGSNLDRSRSGSAAPGSTGPGSTVPGGPVSGSTSPGGTSPGGTSPGGTSPGGTSPGGTSVASAEPNLAYYYNLADAFAGAAEGLQHAHSRGVVHRDIKPSNLILDGDGRLRILDFGLAHLEGKESLTGSAEILGTPLYMSPEQARRRRIPVDHRTDIYSLGATLYEMVTWSPPFHGKDYQDTLSQILQREPAPPRRLNRRIPRDLETIVLKCLRKEPASRYATAEALAQDLRRFARGDPIEARPQGRVDRLVSRAIRHRVRLGVLGAILILSLGILWSFVQYRREAYLRHVADYNPIVTQAAMKILRARQAGPFSLVAPEEVDLSTGGTRGLMVHGTLSPHQREVIHDPLESAIADLRRVVRLVPDRRDAYFYLGRALLLEGDAREAIDHLETALSISPGFAPALALLSVAHRRRGDVELAGQVLDLARSSGRGGWGERWLEAHAAMRERRWSDAVAAHDALLEADGRDGPLYVGSSIELYLERGQARGELRDWDGARMDFAAARALFPTAIEPDLLLARLCYLQGDRDRGDEILRRIIAGAPNRDEAGLAIVDLCRELRAYEQGLPWTGELQDAFLRQRARAVFHSATGKWDEALADLRGALEARPGDPDTRNFLGWVHLKGKEDAEEARKCFDLVLAADPKHPGARAGLCELARLRKEFDSAREQYERLLESHPGEVWILYEYGWFLIEQEKGAEAARMFERAIELEPSSSELRRVLAVALSMQDRDEEAVREFEAAARANPRNPHVYNNLGWALYKMTRFEDAEKALLRAIELDPSLAWPYRNLGLVYNNLRRNDPAIEMYRKAVERDPTFGWTHHDLAWALFDEKRFAESMESYCRSLRLIGMTPWTFWRTEAMLRLAEKPPELLRQVDDLVEVLERIVAAGTEEAGVFAILSLAQTQAPTRRDLDGALENARKCVALGGEKDPKLGAFVAEALAARGQAELAVLELERVLEKSRAGDPALGERLASLRAGLLPFAPSLWSVDAALDATPEEARRRDLLAAFDADQRGKAAPDLREYLRSSILQREGKLEEALSGFERVSAKETGRHEPALRSVACLRGLGRPAEAEGCLRRTIGSAPSPDPALWEAWCAVCMVDLRLAPGQILERLPPPAPGAGSAGGAPDAEPGGAGELGGAAPTGDRYRRDLAWLLGALASGAPLRIDCGTRREGSSVPGWSGDRFHFGGGPSDGDYWKPDGLEIRGTETPALFRRGRTFGAGSVFPTGYRIPVPPGRYRVRLHFAECFLREPGSRIFDVRIDGKEAFPEVEPLAAGFATAMTREWSGPVGDGLLEIEFVPRKDEPAVCGVEVEPMGG